MRFVANEHYITLLHQLQPPPAGELLNLSLFLSPGQFTYAVSGHEFNTVYELCDVGLTRQQDMLADIAFLLANHQLGAKKFGKVLISVLNKDFTLVPEAYLGEEARHLLEFATGGGGAGQVFQQHRLPQASMLYALDAGLCSLLEKTFPYATVRHAGAVSLALFFGQQSLRDSNIYLALNGRYIELAARQGNKLLFYNVFLHETDEDVLYYLLFAMEQLNISPQEAKLCLSGQIGVEDELVKQLKRYIREVKFCVRAPGIALPAQAASLPMHQYFTLLNQHQCEL